MSETTTTTTTTTEYVIPESVVDGIIERIAKRVAEMLRPSQAQIDELSDFGPPRKRADKYRLLIDGQFEDA